MPERETNIGDQMDALEWRASGALMPASISLVELMTAVASREEKLGQEELLRIANEFMVNLVGTLAGALDFQAERAVASAEWSMNGGRDLLGSADSLKLAADAFRRILPQE